MLILLALAVSAGQWDKSTTLRQQQASEISAWLSEQESEAQNGLGTGSFLVHRGDSLLLWSNVNVIPSKRDLKDLSEKSGYSLFHLPQGYFLVNVAKRAMIPVAHSFLLNMI